MTISTEEGAEFLEHMHREIERLGSDEASGEPELRAALVEAKRVANDLKKVMALPPPEQLSRRQLHDFVELGGSRPFACRRPYCDEQRKLAMGVALECFRLGGKIGDGGRAGMHLAMCAALDYLTMNLPTGELELLEPLFALQTVLEDLENGVTPPAAKTTKLGGNRSAQGAVDLKARCLVVSEILMKRGLTKLDADRFILTRVRNVLPLVGLCYSAKALDNWRRDARRQGTATRGLTSRLRQLREHLSHCDTLNLSPDGLLRLVLGIVPSMTPSSLAHLQFAGPADV